MTEMDETTANYPHLHILMPELKHQRKLTVRQPCHLRVSILPQGNDNKRQYAVDHIDVVVLCPGSKVKPLRQGLPLPPKSDSIVEFELTPSVTGKFVAEVLLLVQNQCIHTSEFYFEVHQS